MLDWRVSLAISGGFVLGGIAATASVLAMPNEPISAVCGVLLTGIIGMCVAIMQLNGH
jgi:ABC-type uncharacterized transport system permease subunit